MAEKTMHAPGLTNILLILLVVLVFFGGRGKLSGIMTDLAQGIKGFKKGLQDEDVKTDEAKRVEEAKTIDATVVNKETTNS